MKAKVTSEEGVCVNCCSAPIMYPAGITFANVMAGVVKWSRKSEKEGTFPNKEDKEEGFHNRSWIWINLNLRREFCCRRVVISGETSTILVQP